MLIALMKNLKTSEELLKDIYKRFINGDYSKRLDVSQAYLDVLRREPFLINTYRETLFDVLRAGEPRLVQPVDLLQFVLANAISWYLPTEWAVIAKNG